MPEDSTARAGRQWPPACVGRSRHRVPRVTELRFVRSCQGEAITDFAPKACGVLMTATGRWSCSTITSTPSWNCASTAWTCVRPRWVLEHALPSDRYGSLSDLARLRFENRAHQEQIHQMFCFVDPGASYRLPAWHRVLACEPQTRLGAASRIDPFSPGFRLRCDSMVFRPASRPASRNAIQEEVTISCSSFSTVMRISLSGKGSAKSNTSNRPKTAHSK